MHDYTYIYIWVGMSMDRGLCPETTFEGGPTPIICRKYTYKYLVESKDGTREPQSLGFTWRKALRHRRRFLLGVPLVFCTRGGPLKNKIKICLFYFFWPLGDEKGTDRFFSASV